MCVQYVCLHMHVCVFNLIRLLYINPPGILYMLYVVYILHILRYLQHTSRAAMRQTLDSILIIRSELKNLQNNNKKTEELFHLGR